MNLTKIKHLLAICMITAPLTIMADEQNATPVSIVEEITSDGNNSIVMPEMLLKRLMPATGSDGSTATETDPAAKPSGKSKVVGFRVQIFSSNNAASAKSEANSKARQSMSRFPQYRSYVTYSSPYWKVRVGDFRTSQEASAAASSLRGTFGNQVCVVRDYVYVR